jgi:PPK2 family polyphosphate:nucleotide phosphotransferase
MKPDDLERVTKQAHAVAAGYRVGHGKRFRLKNVHPDDTGPFKGKDKPRAQAALAEGIQALADLQERLYAHNRWSVLLIFQAMDAAGKDSVIKHVMSGLNPQGCQVASFKAPSGEEIDHDFLWRCQRQLPERGRIGIFNRSYYEEVLVVRVHPQLLLNQRLPEPLVTKDLWKERFEDIGAFERFQARNGCVIRKFFLHVSKDEQRKRFLERIDRPEKNWKFSAGDVAERAHWKNYMDAYEDAIRHTAAREAPWYVVPADHKWFTRVVVAAAVVDGLASLDLSYPPLGPDQQKEIRAAKRALTAGA